MDANITELIRESATRLKERCDEITPILINEQSKISVIYNPLNYA